MATKKKAKQKTLLNVKQDAVGRKAMAYLRKVKAFGEAKVAKEEAGTALIRVMREKGRRAIRVAGRMVTLRHLEVQDVIKVSKAKDK